MRFLKRGEHLIEIAARLIDRQAAEAVVAAELHDCDCGVKTHDGGEGCERILGGGAAGALVDDFVGIAVRVEHFLEEVRIGLAWLESVAGGDAVAKADENGAIRDGRGGGKRASCRQQQEKSDENESSCVHVFSVCGCGRWMAKKRR